MCWLIDYSWWRAAGVEVVWAESVNQSVFLHDTGCFLLSLCDVSLFALVCLYIYLYVSWPVSQYVSMCLWTAPILTSLSTLSTVIALILSYLFFKKSLAFLLSVITFLQELRLWPPDSSRRQTLKRLWSLLMKGFRLHWTWRRRLVREETVSLIYLSSESGRFWGFIYWRHIFCCEGFLVLYDQD